jgi:hypothetical protein
MYTFFFSCWAFASTSVVESAVAKASGLLFDLSVEQMVSNLIIELIKLFL